MLEKELTTVSRYVKRTYSSVTDPLARALWRVLSNYLGMTRTLSNYTVLTVLLMLKSWLVIANHVREFCSSYDYDNNNVTQVNSGVSICFIKKKTCITQDPLTYISPLL